ncbi:MAG: AMP-binding protein, partial [Nocardioidaceae bacterium]
MQSTMQDFPLTIGAILRHGTGVHPHAEVVTATADGTRSTTYAELGRRAARLANGLRSLGVDGDQRVATFQWNNAEHLEAYFAVPSMGAVLHTLNIRLFPEQLAYVINHAEDEVIIVDDSIIPLLARVTNELTTVKSYVVVGDGDASALEATGCP